MDERSNMMGGPGLFKALAAFQATKPAAKMDGKNPHYKSKYATLAASGRTSRRGWPCTRFGLACLCCRVARCGNL